MLILACDTSSSNCSAAISENGIILSEININYDKQHSTLLMPMIETLFQNVNKKPKDIDYFVVNKGPGSFTGLRIGLSVLKAMANALNKPLISIDTFITQSYAFRFFNGYILVLNDALRKTFYSTLYKSQDGFLHKVLDDKVRTLDEVLNDIVINNIKPNSLLIIGDGLLKYREEINSAFKDAMLISDTECIIKASNLIQIAEYLIRTNKINDEINPYYMRKPQAEREYDEKHGIKD